MFWKRWFGFGKDGEKARQKREHLEQTKDGMPGFPFPTPRKPKDGSEDK